MVTRLSGRLHDTILQRAAYSFPILNTKGGSEPVRWASLTPKTVPSCLQNIIFFHGRICHFSPSVHTSVDMNPCHFRLWAQEVIYEFFKHKNKGSRPPEMEASSSQELGKPRKKRIGCSHLNYYMEMTSLKNTMLPNVPTWSSYIIYQNMGMPGTSYLSSSFPTKPTTDAENHPSLPNFLLGSHCSALTFENTRKETQRSSVVAGFWMKRASLTVGPLLQLELQVMCLGRAPVSMTCLALAWELQSQKARMPSSTLLWSLAETEPILQDKHTV